MYKINIRKEKFGGTLFDLTTGKRSYINYQEFCDIQKNIEFPNDINVPSNISNEEIKFTRLNMKNDGNHYSFADIVFLEITRECNLRCKHCLNNSGNCLQNELSFEELSKIVKDLAENGVQEIRFTGGEPLINDKVYELLKLSSENGIYTVIGTNGTLITKEVAKKLKDVGLMKAVVSIDGSRKSHDYIRGKGTYEKIAKGITNLRNNDIFTSISFTATNLNYKEFTKVVKYARKYNVNNVWSDRYIPLGGSEDKNLMLNYEQTREYLNIMSREREKLMKKKNNITTISMYRALQFQMTDDFAYGCTAGDTLLTVMENGDLVPCRRMPIVVGNLLKENMYNLYKNNKLLKELRKNLIPSDCVSCEHSEMCHGGLKCLTYAIYKDLNHKDLGCDL